MRSWVQVPPWLSSDNHVAQLVERILTPQDVVYGVVVQRSGRETLTLKTGVRLPAMPVRTSNLSDIAV